MELSFSHIISSPQDLLTKVGEGEIFEKYSGGKAKVTTDMFCSPLRVDRHPSCRFYRNRRGRLILRDFSGHFHGDCFDFVMAIKKIGFNDALIDIASTFGIESSPDRKPIEEAIKFERLPSTIAVNRAEWDVPHISYWENHGVSMKTLELLHIIPVKRIWLNGKIYYNRDFSTISERIFAYPLSDGSYQIYFPDRQKGSKFIHSSGGYVHGYEQLPESGETLIITKSMKDVACITENNIPAISPSSESVVFSKEFINSLKSRFKKVYTLMDRDVQGVRALRKYISLGTLPLRIPNNGRKFKDFADICLLDKTYSKTLVQKFKEL